MSTVKELYYGALVGVNMGLLNNVYIHYGALPLGLLFLHGVILAATYKLLLY